LGKPAPGSAGRGGLPNAALGPSVRLRPVYTDDGLIEAERPGNLRARHCGISVMTP